MTRPVADTAWQEILRRRFDRAAPGYGRLARVQQGSADTLLAEAGPLHGVVLDLGCGSGHLARTLAMQPAITRVLALDLSEGMLRVPEWGRAPGAVEPGPAPLNRLVADAACLPLAAGSVDALLSNFALHWCPEPLPLMRELRRVVRADGLAQLAIPVAGSLDIRPEASGRGAALRDAGDWHAAAGQAGWQVARAEVAECREYHADARAWLEALRAMGVTARQGSGAGLLGRQGFRALLERLELAREPDGIPLSYRVWRARLHPR